MGVEHLIQEGSSKPPPASPSGYSGTILDTAATVADDVRVTIISIDDEFQTHGPCKWMPRDGIFPTAGDECVVLFDERGTPWISVWYPAE